MKEENKTQGDSEPHSHKQSGESILIKTFDENMTPDIKQKTIEEFYKDEEKEFKENLEILESLNSKLVSINRENNQDIDHLETFLEDYKIKNMNLVLNNQKILSEVEQHEMSEKQMQEKLKELEKILELQENQKFLHEDKV